MAVDRFMGVEEARGKLGQVVEEVAAGAEPVTFTKRGQALAVVISRDEYGRLREAASRLTRLVLQEQLNQVRDSIEAAGLESSAVDEAIKAARQLT